MNLQHNLVGANDPNLYQRGMNTNLRGLNTQFGTDFGINDNNNKIINNSKEIYNKYDVIPGNELQFKYINRPHKLVIAFKKSEVGKIILNEPFKDVVSVKLLNAIYVEAAPATGGDTATQIVVPLFITLSINELNKNYSTTDPTGESLLNSFATLEYDKTYDRDNDSTLENVNIYKNRFGVNGDIKYFDPPLNSLSQLNVALYDDETTTPSGGSDNASYKCKLEFMVETKEKLRVY